MHMPRSRLQPAAVRTTSIIDVDRHGCRNLCGILLSSAKGHEAIIFFRLVFAVRGRWRRKNQTNVQARIARHLLEREEWAIILLIYRKAELISMIFVWVSDASAL